jgi:chromosome segregation ATPase
MRHIAHYRHRRNLESEISSLQHSFEQVLHQLSDAETRHSTADQRAIDAEKRSEALAAALNESRSRCILEQQQCGALQLQLQRFESEHQTSKLLASQLAAAEATIADLQQKFNDADRRAFAAERRSDALVQELRVSRFFF